MVELTIRTTSATGISKSYTVGYNPTGICFDGTNVWVVWRNNITKLRANDGSILGNFGVLTNPFSGICFDGTNIWVTNGGNNINSSVPEMGNTVTKLNGNDGSILGTYPVGGDPKNICFDGTNIWVVNWGSGTVTKLRVSDGSILGTYAVGKYPAGICFDGTNIWVANGSGDTITKLKASNGSVLGYLQDRYVSREHVL